MLLLSVVYQAKDTQQTHIWIDGDIQESLCRCQYQSLSNNPRPEDRAPQQLYRVRAVFIGRLSVLS